MSTSGLWQSNPAVILNPPMTISQRIKRARKQARLTQAALAELVGVTSQSVTQWESGAKTPSRDNLIRLSEVLGVSINSLLTPSSLQEQKSNHTLTPVFGVVHGGRTVPLVAPNDVFAPDKISIQKTTISTSYPCGKRSFAIAMWDKSNESSLPLGTVIIIDPDKEPEPGSFVIGHQKDKPIAGILSYSASDNGIVAVVTPLNKLWPEHRASKDFPIEIAGVKTEAHLRG